jgi:hypothetical protein
MFGSVINCSKIIFDGLASSTTTGIISVTQRVDDIELKHSNNAIRLDIILILFLITKPYFQYFDNAGCDNLTEKIEPISSHTSYLVKQISDINFMNCR